MESIISSTKLRLEACHVSSLFGSGTGETEVKPPIKHIAQALTRRRKGRLWKKASNFSRIEGKEHVTSRAENQRPYATCLDVSCTERVCKMTIVKSWWRHERNDGAYWISSGLRGVGQSYRVPGWREDDMPDRWAVAGVIFALTYAGVGTSGRLIVDSANNE